MTISAVQGFCEDIINGLIIPGEANPLECHVIPPVPGKIKGPYAFVYVDTWEERREAGPRNTETTSAPNYTGKYVIYKVLIDLSAIYNPNPKNTKRWRFANYIETVQQAFRGNITDAQQKSVTIPVQVFDEVTGESSWITKIGEDWSGRQFPMVTLEDQRTLYAQAELEMTVEEQRTG